MIRKFEDFGLTETEVIKQGYTQVLAEVLNNRIVDKTIHGDYYVDRKYVSYLGKDGSIEGINDLGSFVTGKWHINDEDNTLSLVWDGYWHNWTGRAYEVNNEIKLFDTTTLLWRTTFKLFEDGKKEFLVEK